MQNAGLSEIYLLEHTHQFTEFEKVFTLPMGITKMRVYMWIEGQDVDCWNQIASGRVYANLEFYGREIKISQKEGE